MLNHVRIKLNATLDKFFLQIKTKKLTLQRHSKNFQGWKTSLKLKFVLSDFHCLWLCNEQFEGKQFVLVIFKRELKLQQNN